jgi:hypothetical protein
MARRIVHCVLLLALLLALAACVSPQELRQRDEATCVGYGFHRGTPDFAACLQRESLARRYGGLWYGPPTVGWYGPPGWYPYPR